MTTRPYHQDRYVRHAIPPDILALSHERDMLRRRGHYDRADVLKRQIEEAGYVIKDNPHGAHLITLPSIDVDGTVYRTARHIPSLVDEPDTCLFSVVIVARNSFEQTSRCIESVFRFAGTSDIEVMLVDNASQDGLSIWADALRSSEPRFHVLRTSRAMGEAEAHNIGLKQSQGHYILLLNSSIELTGDIFTPLMQVLADKHVGIAGLRGLRTDDLRHFEARLDGEVEAVEGVCMAFQRALLKQTGFFDEQYRYPYYMDIDFNFAIRDKGMTARVIPDLPVTCLPVLPNTSIPDAERARLTKRNFYRFLDKWGDRDDLLIEEE